MKEVKAYIRRDRLDPVINALARIDGLTGVSVSTVTGFGRSRGRLRFVDFESHIKIETVCDDTLMDMVIATMQTTACTHQRGDGKIFVSDIRKMIRIETGTEIDALHS
jgi:nitrogen regulatory protein P-II 1